MNVNRPPGHQIQFWIEVEFLGENSKISAEEKKERSGWGRVELGQLGTSWSSNSSGDENCLCCEDVCLRCAIFSEDYREMRDESSNMKSRIQEDIRRAVSVKASEEATWKGIKVQQKYFCVIKISGFVVQKKAWGVNIFSRLGGWKRRRKTWAIKVGLDACCRGVNPARFKMIQDYPLGWYRLRGRSVDGEKRSTG